MVSGLNSAPLVSIVMGVHNAEDYVIDAITSVLNQDYANIELIVVDDASTDSTPRKLAAIDDSRMFVLRQEKNGGLAAALNLGIRHSRGTFIARFDADDICYSERVSKQVGKMLSNPQLGLLGGSMMAFEDGHADRPMLVQDTKNILAALLKGNAIMHPTVMMRRSVLLEHHLSYSEVLPNAQDYELWSKMALVTEIANTRDIVVRYRIHPRQQTSLNRNRQRRIALQVQWNLLTSLDVWRSVKIRHVIRGYLAFGRHLAAWVFFSIKGLFAS